jgi:hypothetical protein
MRRLLRILLNVATVASFVLCFATTVLWVRSYLVCDLFVRLDFDRTPPYEAHARRVISQHGTIAWAEETSRNRKYEEPRTGVWDHGTISSAEGGSAARWLLVKPTGWQEAGFIFHRGYQPAWADTGNILFVPDLVIGLAYWAIVVASAILPLLWCRRVRRRIVHARRCKRGCCAACGYDLRATPGRCPECGRSSPTAVAVAHASLK